MNEEQAVLNFFAETENLSLALSVGEQVDQIRQNLNNEFWLLLNNKIHSLFAEWTSKVTEDRNNANCLVGLNLRPQGEQNLFLQPMMEQQVSSNGLRIYFGLMWSSAPTNDKTNLAEVLILRDALLRDGYKSNESFLAWQWTQLHPRSKDFLLGFTSQREEMLDRSAKHLSELMNKHADDICSANHVLATTPQSTAISLTSLRKNIPD